VATVPPVQVDVVVDVDASELERVAALIVTASAACTAAIAALDSCVATVREFADALDESAADLIRTANERAGLRARSAPEVSVAEHDVAADESAPS
jgi:hypothetical protein